MSATVAINPGFESALVGLLDDALGEAVSELADVCRQELSQPYPPASSPMTPAHMRTGGLREAVFSGRLDEGDWVYGYRHVSTDPARPNSNRERLGLWAELGTGTHRHRPDGNGGIVPSISPIVRTSMEPRPVLLPTLIRSGPSVVASKLQGASP